MGQKLNGDSTRVIYFKRWKLCVDDDRSWITWHFECEIQCELFKASGTNSSRLAKKILWTSLSFFFFSFSLSFSLFPFCLSSSLSLSQTIKRREMEGEFFLFLFSITATLRESYDDYSFVFFSAFLEKTRRNKKREKLICVAGIWQKRKLWIKKRRRCRYKNVNSIRWIVTEFLLMEWRLKLFNTVLII